MLANLGARGMSRRLAPSSRSSSARQASRGLAVVVRAVATARATASSPASARSLAISSAGPAAASTMVRPVVDLKVYDTLLEVSA